MNTNIQKRRSQLRKLSRDIQIQQESINDKKEELFNGQAITVEYHFLQKNLVEDLNKAFSKVSILNKDIVSGLTGLLTIQNENTQLLCNIMLSLSTAELSLYTKVKDIAIIQKNNSKNIDFLVDEFIKSIDKEDLPLEKKIDAFENLMDGTHDDIASIINGLAEESKQHTNNIQSHTDKFAKIQTEIQSAVTQYTQYYSDVKQQIATLETELPQKVSTSIFKEELNKKADSSALCQYVKTDDSRLTDARPASDVPNWAKAKQKPEYKASEIKDLNIPTKTSQLNNDCGFLTEHQDISGKADISFVEKQLQRTKDNLSQEVTTLQQTLQKTQEDLQKEHQGYTKLKKALIATSICTGVLSLGALIALLILIL